MKAFLKSKWTIAVVILLILGTVWTVSSGSKTPTPPDTFTVVRQELVRTVEASGSLKPGVDAALAFGASGMVEEILVQEGDTVERGEILARLNMRHLDAQWERSQQSFAVAQVQLNAAVQTEKDIQITTTVSVQQAEDAVTAARVALANTDSDTGRSTVSARTNMELALSSAIIVVRDALSDADAILGIENSLTNDTFEAYLAANDPNALSNAQASMRLALNGRHRAEDAVRGIVTTSTDVQVESVVKQVDQELTTLADTLLFVRRVLDATTSNASVYSLTDVTSDKATIDVARAAVQNERESLQATLSVWRDAIGGGTETVTAKQAALQATEHDAEQARATALSRQSDAASTRALREASLAQSQAELAIVDAQRADYLLIAPVRGVVTKVSADPGERLTIGATAMVVHSLQDTWYADVQVPESDIDLITVQQPVEVRFDAFGDEQIFSANVEHIDPSSQTVEGVVYYRVLLSIIAKEGIALRTGLSLDADIQVSRLADAIVVPQRAIFGTTQERRVRILMADGITSEERVIELGVRGNGGLVEVMSGLQEGDRVLLSHVE